MGLITLIICAMLTSVAVSMFMGAIFALGDRENKAEMHIAERRVPHDGTSPRHLPASIESCAS